MNWFTKVFKFKEQGRTSIYENLFLEGEFLYSKVTKQTKRCGRLEIPNLLTLREQTKKYLDFGCRSTLHEIVADVQSLHVLPSNKNAVFQVASQCNLLEMVGPSVTPEEGITQYFWDRTQGPACAIAAAAGTIQRNYFVELTNKKGETQIGQSESLQVDTLFDLGQEWGNDNDELWVMKNGYALATWDGLQKITAILESTSAEEYHQLLGLLRIGMQWDTEVTVDHFHDEILLVSQAYCSAMPVAYSDQNSEDWEQFARFVLKGSYEATLLAAILQSRRENNSNKVFLTLLGGGAFGNRTDWILDAIMRAMDIVKNAGLEIYIVSYGRSQVAVQELLRKYNA